MIWEYDCISLGMIFYICWIYNYQKCKLTKNSLLYSCHRSLMANELFSSHQQCIHVWYLISIAGVTGKSSCTTWKGEQALKKEEAINIFVHGEMWYVIMFFWNVYFIWPDMSRSYLLQKVCSNIVENFEYGKHFE